MKKRRVISTAAGVVLGAFALLLPGPAMADTPNIFGIETFASTVTDEDENDYLVAGGHPDLNSTSFSFDHNPGWEVLEITKDTLVTLKPGFLGNPAAAPRCPITSVRDPGQPGTGVTDCPFGSQVGEATLAFGNAQGDVTEYQHSPLYNLVPEVGYPAQFGFVVLNKRAVLSAVQLPRTESYSVQVGSANVGRVGLRAFSVNFWGVPFDHGSGNAESPFLFNPVNCSEAEPTWKLAADSWEHAGAYLPSGRPALSDPNWKTATVTNPPVTECDDPALAEQFEPGIAVKPLQGGAALEADQPTGLAVDLDFPQSNDPTDPNTTFDPDLPQAPEPKDITVKLPAGLSISPSSGDGLAGCSDQASDPAGDQVHYDSTKPVTCPDASKIGTASALSPLVAAYDPVDEHVVGPDPIPGDIYLLKPHPGDLPAGGSQDGRFRLLIQLESAVHGLNYKLPGVATADKQTGQLSMTFSQNPQQPSSHIQVSLKPGPRASLASPVSCGSFQVDTDIVPWSTPDTEDAHPTASFAVDSGPNGSACAGSPGTRPFSPAVSAGSKSNAAGRPSPLSLHITRKDGEGELGSLEMTLPKGLAAKFAGIPYCSDAALATAAGRSGKDESASQTCPASHIGSVTVGAGPGPNPFYTQGNAYLAGPYKGAPMSVAVITPAVAGPFDLGTVVIRNALYIDPETAQGRVVSDPFPMLLDGVPLRIRDITVDLDRPDFTLNPTSCDAMQVTGTITALSGQAAPFSSPFQAGGCANIGFKPKLALSLKGGTRRTGHPALKAVLTPRPGDANINRAAVALPKSELLDQSHIGTVCTRVQFAAAQCPAASVYGFARATTPLLDDPVQGPIYLRSSSNKLPDLVADLRGQINVVVVGRIDSAKDGGIRTTFEAVPDTPVSQFVLELQGGKKGLLINSGNLCKKVNKATSLFEGQNGMTYNTRPVVTNDCKKGKAKGKRGAKKRGTRRSAARLMARISWPG